MPSAQAKYAAGQTTAEKHTSDSVSDSLNQSINVILVVAPVAPKVNSNKPNQRKFWFRVLYSCFEL
jgi:hypothetical protein